MDITLTKLLLLLRLDSIRVKVILSCSIVILIMMWTSFNAYVQVSKLKESELRENLRALQKQVMDIKLGSHEFILKDRNNVKFFSSGKSEYIDHYARAFSEYQQSSAHIKSQLAKTGFRETQELDLLDQRIDEYNFIFKDIESRIRERGIDNYGIIGDFDVALQKMNRFDFGSDNITLVRLKYFIREYQLNGSVSTVQQVSDETYRFSNLLEKYITDKQVEEVIYALTDYEDNFKKLVKSDSALGLYSGKGLQEKLFMKMSEVDNLLQLTKTDAQISATYSGIVNKTMISLTIILLSCFLLAVVIYILLHWQILVPIRMLNGIIRKMSDGIIPDVIPNYTSRELKYMVESLSKLSEGFKRTSEFAKSVGEGNFEVSFSKLSEQDVLGNALLRMHGNLKKADEGEKQRQWAADGFTIINNMLRAGMDLNQLSEKCLARLVRYLNANQGTLFVLNDQEGEFMELVGTYACVNVKRGQRIERGQDLIGQCWIEKKSFHLEAIPKGFIKIGSGLGTAEPKHVLIVPLIAQEEVYGIIEIASFNKFEKHQQIFLEDIGVDIATVIYNQKVKERTNQLLEELQVKVSS
jgi:hypothetical protein